MTLIHEIRPDIDDGIDRKVLAQLRQRFLKINAGRLQRASEALSSRQQLVLRLLPLLFDVNHPLLPGYVSASTPAGLSGFVPDDDILAEAQRLTRSFSYKTRRGNPPLPIHGLFLMGSLGTVAQAEQSDLDLWVCHASELSAPELGELRRKCDLLEQWAATQGTEVHCFLVEPQRFTQGAREARLTSDDCGTSQHYLLLDEFYRTAIWLGGRTPLWWLVPVYEEGRYAEYCQTLLNKRFIRADEVLDLGHLAHIPPGEFIGAGMWQLFKGIESPYKSVLKLLLTEVYASEHPQVACLSLRYKQAIYAGRLDLEELDPYVMLYRRLEEYLVARGEQERLELIRRCLYLKVGKKLGRPPRQGRKSWQRKVMERLSAEWKWDSRAFGLLDSRSQWKVRQVLLERRALVNELTHSYRFLSQFARLQQAASGINPRDLGILGRRLYAAFERKAGKVEFINPGIAPDMAEDILTLAHLPAGEAGKPPYWALFAGNLSLQEMADFAPLRRARDLMELLAWSHRNGVIDTSTRLSLQPGASDLSEFELQNLLGCLQQAFPLPLAEVPESALLRSSVPSQALILVNVGIDPLRQHSQMNVHMTTERTDSLGYSGVRDNLVLTLDQITLNSWNELLVSRFAGPHALLDCLREFLNGLPGDAPPPRLVVRCYCRNRANAIAQRVEELFRDAYAQLASGRGGRYLLQVRRHFHLLHLLPGNVSHRVIEGLPALIEHLGDTQDDSGVLQLDRHALEGDDLAMILPLGRANTVQVFYRLDEGSAEVTVLDERNALWRRRQDYDSEEGLLLPLQRFLQSVQYRRNAMIPLLLEAQGPVGADILFYEVIGNGHQRAQRVERRNAPQALEALPYYNVQAIVEPGDGQRARTTLYCNHREFSELEFGAELFQAAARHILDRRRGQERYPCYITDLDLSAMQEGGELQTVHFLRYKQSLEQALNRALAEA
ncbi:class I adenylate cyclase [Pseudomonas sp. ZM23]|uniref:Class I adenylate cyclase n=1 Tax=Pseudomonas triclosanedens TaxID=2961893 RepID=A0ABY6ZYM4_9PSED|nr:class I adenylate cyclase [Pseudomonas triclosanedens]MCP8466889.1 class I adenylate cyclase [Pseudomonas triclosanedens]MCP8470113.1 class I adenylate cyclase [Pseudomonas triclosanedens]MCP8478023.1 class I adenylate cyclase [Pseudomonas triclosanedens]WAI49436.1 class I adenylate cyclase [Pseudomonas triclosanedens]